MGGIESRFQTLLLEGRTEEAMSMWVSNPENLQEIFHPNVPIKGSPYRDNPLHCSARHGMKILMHEFLEKGADPFSRNDNGETAMHIVCRTARGSSRTSKRQADLLYLLLDKIPEVYTCLEASYHVVADPDSKGERKRLSETWPALRGSAPQHEDSQEDKLHLGIQDKARNTPLHLAAASGLLSCVELLLAHGAPLFVQNVAGQTPCDVAWEAKQLIIAKQLESKMVLTGEREQESRPISRLRNKSFHNAQTLKKLKKDIVENVANRLSIAEFPAQALLMSYGWSEDLVVEAWEQDREEACNKAGIDPAQTSSNPSGSPLSSLSLKQCTICFEDIAPAAKISVPCGHHFCQECWKRYLKSQIQEGAGKEIRCPGHGCFKVVPNEVVGDLVPEDLFKKYMELNLHQFVDLYADVKWCPFPDCEQAVSLKQVGGAAAAGGKGGGAAGVGRPGLNVECGNGHGFCWYCMKEPHEPCECELWEKWKEVIVRMTTVNGKTSKVASEAVANARWIMKCTKPCPNCKSPIQKTEGCNQMTCRKCLHSFCWVCLDPWSVHNHKTGGYFTCNRFKAQRLAEQEVSTARKNMEHEYVRAAEEDQRRKKEKFEHYYERYSNHLNSLEIELKLLQESQTKTKEMEKLGQALEKKVAAVRAKALLEASEEDGACAVKPEENFLEEIFRVLLHARRILSASYCIGYFIPDKETAEIRAHETLQGKLEDGLEVLSQQVNRPYLKTPQAKMGEAARNVDYLCEEYLKEMKEVAKAATIVEQKPQPKPRQQERLRRIPSFETNLRTRPTPRQFHQQPVDSLRLYRAPIHDL